MESFLEREYEVIVIGAGVMGSSTAYFLTKHFGPNKVLLLEQYDWLHRKGSSHGESRIIRRTYEQEHYTYLMDDAYKLWQQIESEAGTKVFTQTGGIDIASHNNSTIQSVISAAKKYSVPHQILNPSQAKIKFPTLKIPDENKIILYSPDSGILNATKSVLMFQTLHRQFGGHLMDNAKVNTMEKDQQIFKLTTITGKIAIGKKLIITAGAWTGKFVKQAFNIDLPLKPIQTSIAYWKILSKNNLETYSSKNFPVFINYDEPLMYGTPAHEYPNMIKCSAHYGVDCNPDERDFEPIDTKIMEEVVEFIQTHFVGIDTKPKLTETCMYTTSPDYDYILDELVPNVWIGCGFSGHGFKLAPVVGKILAQYAINGQFPYNDNIKKYFTLARFDKGKDNPVSKL